MILEDDRTAEQKASHTSIVIGTDSFLSGWGAAKGGASYAAWACKPEHFDRVRSWVESRKDMKRVRFTFGSYRPKGAGHCHIYVVNEGHPALGG